MPGIGDFFDFFFKLTLDGSITCYINLENEKRMTRNHGDSDPNRQYETRKRGATNEKDADK